jgi:hemoglobin
LREEVMSTDARPAEHRRAQIIDDIAARTGIDEAMIERLVRAFYARVMGDALLGPIFTARVGDWDVHIAKMCAFWSSVALMSGRWLAIFAETAHELCPPAAAAHFLERAHRIADSLALAIAARNGEIKPRRKRPDDTFRPIGAASAG